jgi:hypothetical protein
VDGTVEVKPLPFDLKQLSDKELLFLQRIFSTEGAPGYEGGATGGIELDEE